MVRPLMLTQHPPGRIHNLALRQRNVDTLLFEVRIDERRVIAIRNETNFLAVILIRYRQAKFFCQQAHIALHHAAQWK